MTTRAGLASRIALGAVLVFGAFTLTAQAAPIPVLAPTIQILPVTAPVPNVHFTNLRHEDLVQLQAYSQLGSAPARGTIHVHGDARDSSVLELVRRKGGGGHGHPAPAPAAHPAPAQHNAPPPPPAHHHMSIAAKIRHAFHKVGEGISHAVHAVGHFMHETGAKIVKVALKVVATAQKIASKVVGWLPGIGKPLGKIMEGESEGLNKASDAIHAHIGGKLGEAMHKMDHAQKIVGYIPRSYIPERFEERAFEERGLEERGFGDLEEFKEREWEWDAELEVRGLHLDWENMVERGTDDEEVFMF